jgi:hypothetical protein
MKTLLPLLLCLALTTSIAQTTFILPTPKDWAEELIPFPIEFAPSIPYQGEEHLRFTPGWGEIKSKQFWSYCYLWWIEEKSEVSAVVLKQHLTDYYNGLVGRNIISRKIDSVKLVKTVVTIQTLKKGKYRGTIRMLDYMGQQPIILNITIEEILCPEQKKKAVFIAVSPQPASHTVWKDFKGIREGFRCGK